MAAPAIVRQCGAQTAAQNGVSASFAALPSTGNLIVVCGGAYLTTNAGRTFTLSDNQGNTYTRQAFLEGSGNIAVAIWTAPVTTSAGTFTLTATNAGTLNVDEYQSIAALEISGHDTGTLLEVAAVTNSGSSTGPSANLADTTNDCLKIATCTAANVVNINSANNGFTLFDDAYTQNSSFQMNGAAYLSVTGANTVDPSWTLSGSSGWVAAALAIRGAAGGGTTIYTRKPLESPIFNSRIIR
jgi:hypothetical protein